MTLGEKISKFRKENNHTQEQLADILGVSRQAISRWESDTAYPETEKLIRLGKLYGCSLDYLLNDENYDGTNAADTHQAAENTVYNMNDTARKALREMKSQKTLWGMPVWHIGKKARGVIAIGLNAKGIIAIGLSARGVLTFGLLSLGVFSFGMLSVGLLAFGMLALGIVSAGSIAVGVMAFGAVSFGVIAIGGAAIGDFAVGGAAVGKYLAYGDSARGAIALGDSKAAGTLFESTDYTSADFAQVKALLDSSVPKWLSWAKNIIESIIR